jgi:hypothetical protein
VRRLGRLQRLFVLRAGARAARVAFLLLFRLRHGSFR